MNKEKLLNQCLMHDNDPQTIHHHMQRIIKYAKNNIGIVKSNHIAELIDGKISYEEFLNRQSESRLNDCMSMFLFNNEILFLEVYGLIESKKGEFDQNKIANDIEHEKEHRQKADKYFIDSLFGINFNMTLSGRKMWTGKTNPTLVVFLEEKAIREQWDLFKYISIAEDVCNVTRKSSGDIKTLQTIEALKKLPNTGSRRQRLRH